MTTTGFVPSEPTFHSIADFGEDVADVRPAVYVCD